MDKASVGIGKMASIMTILNEVNLGEFYYEMAVVLRESIFLSSILLNSETWMDLNSTDIEELECIDRLLLRKILNTPVSTPIPALYLELGVVPIRFKIQARRLMYLHYILNRKDDELLLKVFKSQCKNPVKGDWCLSVQEDLKDFGLESYSFDRIKKIKKNKFKKIIKKACKATAFKFLMDEKEGKSKLENIDYKDLQLQNYLKAKNVYYKKQSLLFKLRTRMINVNSNYGKTTVCPLCLKSIDNQKHLIQSCEKLLIKDEAQIVYEDIFSNDIIKSIKIAELAHEKIQKRNNLLDKV